MRVWLTTATVVLVFMIAMTIPGEVIAHASDNVIPDLSMRAGLARRFSSDNDPQDLVLVMSADRATQEEREWFEFHGASVRTDATKRFTQAGIVTLFRTSDQLD